MSRDWLLRGRLTPPTYRVALLPTPALLRLEAEGCDHKVVLVTAPAGYGKTALLSQWRVSLRAAGIRTAWMSLTADQTDPSQLLTLRPQHSVDELLTDWRGFIASLRLSVSESAAITERNTNET